MFVSGRSRILRKPTAIWRFAVYATGNRTRIILRNSSMKLEWCSIDRSNDAVVAEARPYSKNYPKTAKINRRNRTVRCKLVKCCPTAESGTAIWEPRLSPGAAQ